MATVLREPEAPGSDPAAVRSETMTAAPEGVAVAFTQEARCEACGATLAPGQDWCLACGTAVRGRLGGERTGWGAGATVVGVVLLLVAGAVTAGYAALSDDANREAATPAGQVAQVPPAATPGLTPPAIPGQTAPVTTPGATTPGAATPGATTTTPGTPPVTPGATGTTPSTTTTTTGATSPSIFGPGSTVTTTPPANTPATGNTTTPTTPPTQTQTQGQTQAQTPRRTQTAPQRPAGPQTIPLGADALSLYDPYKNATAQGDPADADDNNRDTAWFVTSKNATSMGVGLMVDMETARGVKVLGMVTHTPGFRVEVYGSKSEIPADVLDTRWHHIASRSRVDEVAKDKTKAGDKMERVVLGGGTREYRYYLLWFTTPPDAGPTVRLTQVVMQA